MEPTTKEEMDYTPTNIVIADFMGYIHSTHKEYDDYEMKHLTYHKDWNRLIEVWKLVRERFKGLIPQIMLMDQTSEFHSAVDDGDISKAYKAVVDAVNLYNYKIKQ